MSTPEQLITGFKRFRNHYDALLPRLAHSQNPEILVVSCCDSRVDPALILDSLPGDLFVVRNVANLVPPAANVGQYQGTCSALEFGVRQLHVKHIIVLGHAHCGGIRALLRNETPEDSAFIGAWMQIATEARNKILENFADADECTQRRLCEQESILGSLKNLMTFPWIAEAVKQGQLKLHGWYFDIGEGALLGYSELSGQFEKLS